MTASFSIVIITKNRELHLLECLASIFTQSLQPSEIVIVDNNSTDHTYQRVQRLSKLSKIPIRLLQEKKSSYPALRNKGFAAAKTDWIVSIDDDCVAVPEWLNSLAGAIKQNPKAVAFMGECVSFDRQNPFSLTTELFERMWKKNNILNNKIMNFDILDTKNTAYNRKFLNSNKLRFDEKKDKHAGAAEDSDLGIQIFEAHGAAVFVSQMKVAHKNPTTFQTYFSKLLLRYDTRRVLDSKWGNSSGTYVPTKRQRFLPLFHEIRKANSLSWFDSLTLFIVSTLNILFSKLYWHFPALFNFTRDIYEEL